MANKTAIINIAKESYVIATYSYLFFLRISRSSNTHINLYGKREDNFDYVHPLRFSLHLLLLFPLHRANIFFLFSCDSHHIGQQNKREFHVHIHYAICDILFVYGLAELVCWFWHRIDVIWVTTCYSNTDRACSVRALCDVNVM